MKLNRRGKILVMSIIAGTLFSGTKLMANEMSPEMIYKTTKVSSEVSGKVYIPENNNYFEGLAALTVEDKLSADEKVNHLSEYESSYVELGNDTVLLSEGFLTGVDLGHESYSYIGVTEQQGKMYLSYKTIDEDELNHIYLDKDEIEFISADDMQEKDIYKCIGSLVGAVEKVNE